MHVHVCTHAAIGAGNAETNKSGTSDWVIVKPRCHPPSFAAGLKLFVGGSTCAQVLSEICQSEWERSYF